MDLPPGPSYKDVGNVKKVLTDEELLNILENSDEDFDLSLESDLGEGDSADEDCDLECSAQNEVVNDDAVDAVIRTRPVERQSTNYVWVDDPPHVIKVPFSQVAGLKTRPLGEKPIDYFSMLFTDELIDLIVQETNLYAVEIFLASSGSLSSRISQWKDTTIEEMKIFLALLFHTGTIRTNRLEDYWKKSELFDLKFFRSHMSRNRFMLILRALHFSHSESSNRLNKIENIVSYFNKKMEEVYEPSKNLALDESMVLFRGRLVFRQYIKNKRHKYGVKLYMLTESFGLVHRVMIYSGQGHDMSLDCCHTEYVVEKLMEGLFYSGRSLYMDNYYNSIKLAHNLLSKETYCTGTLRQNRKNNPKDITSKKLKVGENVGKYTEKGVSVVKWRDRREVLMISSEFENDMVEVTNRKGQTKIKPLAISKYNQYMSGVDKQDQMMSYYPCERKTIRWYKKIGIHFFQLFMLNSYYLFINHERKITFYDYRLSVISSLCESHNILPRLPVKSQINSIHLPKKLPKNKKNVYLRKRCKLCYSKGKKRVTTIFYCPGCDDEPALCLENCFQEFHS